MAEFESGWKRHPDYRIDLVPCDARVRVWHGDTLLAESDRCIRLEEQHHVDRVYVPKDDVRWEHFEATEHHTVCPFKGEADYWTLTASDPPEENVVWAYHNPLDEVGDIKGYAAFYQDRVRIELEHQWDDGERGQHATTTGFPVWGNAADLVRLLDVQPNGEHRYIGLPYPDTTRNVVEGGQLLGEAIVAASKTIPDQRVSSAYIIFSKAAGFDAPLDLDVDVLRHGRTFSTVEVRISQDDSLRSAAMLLLAADEPDVIRGVVDMPSVPGPLDSLPHDMRVLDREIRIVDGLYSGDPDCVGPPEINAWIRFRDAPAEPYLHAALVAQPTTHWTIAASMLPHAGFGEDQAHRTLSTGPMSVSIAFHDEVDVTEWLLYHNPSIYAGGGLVQGEGHVFTQDGRLVASYTVQAMVRGFRHDPSKMGLDYTNAM
jgi:acyl-CoA thioesterase II